MTPRAMTLTYLDTSALMRRAEALAHDASTRNKTIAPQIMSILDDPTRLLACSELTLVEYHNNLTTNWRNGQLPGCDQIWWASARSDLLDRVASGVVRVLPTPPKAIEQTMSLVTAATRDHGGALRAWDALHVVVAANWAHAAGGMVELVTSDGDFDPVLEIAGFDKHLKIVNLDVLARTGEGADRA